MPEDETARRLVVHLVIDPHFDTNLRVVDPLQLVFARLEQIEQLDLFACQRLPLRQPWEEHDALQEGLAWPLSVVGEIDPPPIEDRDTWRDFIRGPMCPLGLRGDD